MIKIRIVSSDTQKHFDPEQEKLDSDYDVQEPCFTHPVC